MSDKKPTNKMKPRSGLVTDGMERAPARGMLRAVGFKDDDFAKAQIGIASSWNEITPCNLSLDRLAKASKKGVIEAGGFPMQFGTISVSDGISMGHEGMHFSLVSREVIADSVEAVMQAERLDGMVTFAGCDKSLPGMMMAAARLDVNPFTRTKCSYSDEKWIFKFSCSPCYSSYNKNRIFLKSSAG